MKRKKHTNQTPQEGYVAKAVREFYSDLKDVKHDDSNLKAAVTSEAVATGEQNIIPPAATKAIPATIMLADLCEDDSDLHKDAVFLDQLWKLLSDAEITKNFHPHLTSFKRNYITARRSVKKRIQRSREGNQLTENNDNQGEAEEVEEHNQKMAEEDYPNLFD